MWFDTLLKNQIVPDLIIRRQIRKLLRDRLVEQRGLYSQTVNSRIQSVIKELKDSPIAVNTAQANDQHYELPTDFFKYVLGPHLKYSCGWWEENQVDLETSEAAMLEMTCQRADLRQNQDVLELGCGWGALSLYMAQKYPSSNFTVVSNSCSQKEHIDSEITKRGIRNLNVITADINNYSTSLRFDRVVSVEMFEHMRNYQKLLQQISNWLKDDGKLFVHIFTHKTYTYKFEAKDDSDWMSKYFFTGGIMPANDLLFYFDDHLVKEQQWLVNGLNYKKTSEAWLKNMNRNRRAILPLMIKTYGRNNAMLWVEYWRIFFMACAELWGYNGGNEWMVSHYLFRKR